MTIRLAKLKLELVSLAVLIPLAILLGLLLLLWPQTSQAAENVHVYIEGSSQIYFDGSVSAGDCTVTDTAGVNHEFSGTAICALQAAAATGGFSYDAQYYSSFNAVLVSRIGSDTDNYPDGSWLFWVNRCLASVGLSDYPLQDSDAVALTFGTWPEESCMPTPIPTSTPVPTSTPTMTSSPGGVGTASGEKESPTLTPTPTAKRTPRPTVAAAVTVVPPLPSSVLPVPAPEKVYIYVTVTPQPTPEVTPEATLSLTPAPVLHPAPSSPLGGIPLQPVDKTFALSLFGISNAGIGLTLARLMTKL